MSEQRGPVYELYALRYGRSAGTRWPLITSRPSEPIDMAWMVWLAKGDSGCLLIDTGTSDVEGMAVQGITDYVPVEELLPRVGVTAEEIEDLVATHAHWEHGGDVDTFPNARVWIQEREMHYARFLVNERVPEVKALRFKDRQALDRVEEDGRLRMYEGTESPLPGIEARLVGGHTPGSQYVSVPTAKGTAILAGDVAYLYDNLTENLAPWFCIDRVQCESAIREIQQATETPELIIPGHEGKVFDRFPLIEPNIAQIA